MTHQQLFQETSTTTTHTPSPTMGLFGILALGVYFLMVSLLILYVLMAIWPSPKDLEAEPTAALILFGSIPLSIANEVRWSLPVR